MNTKKLIYLIVLFGLLSFLFACGSGNTTTNEPTPEEKAEIKKMDSLSVEMNKTTKRVEEKTEKMSNEVDKLLEGI